MNLISLLFLAVASFAGVTPIDRSNDNDAAGWVDDGTVIRLETSTDKVGIGTTIPFADLDVEGNSQFGDGATKSTFSATGALNIASGENVTLSGSGEVVAVSSLTTGGGLWGFTGMIGSTALIPSTSLDVNGDAQFGSGATKSTFSATGSLVTAAAATVSIGTSATGGKLTIVSNGAQIFLDNQTSVSGDARLQFRTGSVNRGFINVTDSSFSIGSQAAIPVSIQANGTERFFVESGGNIQIGSGGTPLAVISTGTYTPVCTTLASVDTCTPGVAHYDRVGSIVSVCGQITIDPSAASDTATTWWLTIPFASNFTTTTDANGHVTANGIQRAGVAYSRAADDGVEMNFYSQLTASGSYRYCYKYIIQ